MILDATNAVAGRLATYIAKKLMQGKQVIVVNAERAIISGDKLKVTEKYKQNVDRADWGNPRKGPHYPRTPDGIFKRIVRGMLPFKRKRGKEAIKRLKVYRGVPDKFKDSKPKQIKETKKEISRGISLSELSSNLGFR